MITLDEVLRAPALDVAPVLLGATISGRGVRVRITEVEAYMGDEDPGSHGFRGMRVRNRHLFGPGGHLYVYRSYGIHTCVNVVCGEAGVSSGLLLRAGEVVGGIDVARSRRGSVADTALARGPGNFGTAIGARLDEDDGTSLLGGGPYRLELGPTASDADSVRTLIDEISASNASGAHPRVLRGPRTGIRGVAGGSAYPWRFWLADEPTVSAYRRHPAAFDEPGATV
ncbi:DNA-3-methyladenine glycosylase [Curtobacterium ammoniigenes]|uniref:DNA-3-methyladenine glycosylase n=1 Tax=Curtobacterium ammoniigenes TaxID=395387 RepID=UPI00082B9413|nr:DNA-3-methyladenine glycosylase [Curtobacterium ammoniigenes]